MKNFPLLIHQNGKGFYGKSFIIASKKKSLIQMALSEVKPWTIKSLKVGHWRFLCCGKIPEIKNCDKILSTFFITTFGIIKFFFFFNHITYTNGQI
jgi:hypothetical protein